jgi:hypothetical protein
MAQGDLNIELLSGRSDRRSLSLRTGEPIEPVSMGANAFWRIVADGISDVHAFVYFDGEAIFIASGDASNPAVAAGAVVGPEWTEMLPPCEIRLGHAVLAVRPEGAYDVREHPAEMDFDDRDFSTARVDGHVLEAEHRRRKPNVGFNLRDDEPTRMAEPANPTPPIAQRRSRRKPKIKVPSAEESTRYRPIEEDIPGGLQALAAQVRQQPVAPPAAHVQPAPAPQAGYLQQAPSGFVPPGVGAPQAWNGPQPAPVAPMGSFGQGVMAPQAAPVLARSEVTSANSAVKPSPLQKVVDLWKAASIPQKAILCLLPVAFGAVLVMFGDEEPAAPKKKPRPQTSAVVSASAAPAASSAVPVVATAAPPPPETAQPKPAAPSAPGADKGPQPTSGKGAPPRTVNRQAVDAVIAGSHVDAIKFYEQLAAEHPESPVYKEAARILRAKAEGK